MGDLNLHFPKKASHPAQVSIKCLLKPETLTQKLGNKIY